MLHYSIIQSQLLAKSFSGAESAIRIVGDTRLNIGSQIDLTAGMVGRSWYVLSGTKQSVDRCKYTLVQKFKARAINLTKLTADRSEQSAGNLFIYNPTAVLTSSLLSQRYSRMILVSRFKPRARGLASSKKRGAKPA